MSLRDLIKEIKKKIIESNLNLYIKNIINELFINLNKTDAEYLLILTQYLVNYIKNLFNITNDYQFKKNDNRDLKAIILLLLPFIDNEKENIFSNIHDLNQLLYAPIGSKKIPEYIKNQERSDVLPINFKFGNMLLGLNTDELFINGEKLIYEIIKHNFISLLETIKIINGHLYVNWVNIFPLVDYKKSDIYKNKKLYIGEYYNVLRNIYYEDIKPVKWFLFILNGKYIIEHLDEILLLLEDKANRRLFITKIKQISKKILKPIITFMVNNNNLKLKFTYKSLEIENIEIDNEIDIDETYNYININEDTIKSFLDNEDPILIWEFLKNSYNYFKTTIYAKLLKNNNFQNINLKNIYNIAKILSHNNNWILLNKKFSKLSFSDQDLFLNKFFINNNFGWINLKSNLERQYGRFLSNFEYNEKITLLGESWDKIKEDLVWDYLVYAGILTEFIVNPTNRFKTDANYYLNNSKYPSSFLIDLAKEKWYTFYAMDWISQINFFHHYLNHRVIYVTGSTGTGKSTQVPKLLMYALKMIDYNNYGKTICTQPRITPTFDNSTRIAKELGYCIKDNNKMRLNNYYVQFKFATGEHSKLNCNHLTLEIVTDGTLFNEIKSNPELKVKPIKTNTTIDINLLKNVYDILIVDEAHEHNTNMDLILSLGRKSCKLNNSIKLIIVSATMNDDEPIYRAYYKEIDDDFTIIKHPFFNKEFTINNNYLDRRFHISPPGATTQYDIQEIYVDEQISSDNEAKDSKLAQEINYKIIKDICNNSIVGDILLFTNGIADITKAVEYLNETLPLNVITLPFYAQLNEKYKNIISKIDENISILKVKRENVNKLWTSEYSEDLSVPNNIYNRAVIVATNVAEASITINSLKYVVDNGFSKVNIYDIKKDSTNLIIEKISESSRKQRKGRVGRVGSGTVYYAYQKGSREKIKSKYKISSEYFGSTILQLYNNNLEELLDYNGIFYLIHPFENFIKRNFLNQIINKDDIILRENYEILKKSLESKNLIINNKLTKFGENINLIQRTFQTDISDSTILLIAHAYERLESVLGIFTILNIVNNNLTNLIKNFKSTNNDLIFINNLITNFYNYIYEIKSKENDTLLLFKTTKNYKIKPVNVNLEDWNKLLELYYNEKDFELSNQLIIEEEKIKRWCDNYNIDFETMINFFKIFENKKKDLVDLKLEIDNIYTISDEEKIIKPFICGYPNNIDNYLFYLQEKDEDENKRSIINTIKIEWLIKNNSDNIIIQNKFDNRYIR